MFQLQNEDFHLNQEQLSILQINLGEVRSYLFFHISLGLLLQSFVQKSIDVVALEAEIRLQPPRNGPPF